MKVNKLIKSKIERDYFFVKGKLSIDCKYFITEIEKGIKREDNQSFKTNLMSEMTSYKYFMADKKFQEMLLPISDMIDDNNEESKAEEVTTNNGNSLVGTVV